MRSIVIKHQIYVERILYDVRSMVRHLVKFNLAEEHRSFISLRKETSDWFKDKWRGRYAAHYHDSVCSMSVAICKSYWKLRRKYPKTGTPNPDRLVIRLDQGLFRIKDGELVVTVQPRKKYLKFPLSDATKHRHWSEYSKYKMGELTITPSKIIMNFQVPEKEKIKAECSVGIDLNLDFATVLSNDENGPKKVVDYRPMTMMQRRMQRKREKIQKVIPKNLKKQRRVLRKYSERQRNRTIDYIRKTTAPEIVKIAAGGNIIFEDLSMVTNDCGPSAPSKELRRRITRWTHGLIQREVEQRSPSMVVHVNPRGTSSKCPRCGGKVSHPEWRLSYCGNCQELYDRDFAASDNIVKLGHELLWGAPLPPKVIASLAERCKVSENISLTPSPVMQDAGKGDIG